MSDETKTDAEVEVPVVSAKDFFEKIPPGQDRIIENFFNEHRGSAGRRYVLQLPVIALHCGHDSCKGDRQFAAISGAVIEPDKPSHHFVTFRCRNCNVETRTFSFWTGPVEKVRARKVYKYGEHPPFGPHTPPKLIALMGEDREHFLKGRRSESQGLGIGAFSYYRRCVENQKNRIFDQLIDAAKRLRASDELIADLQAAKRETQFTKAIEAVKHGIPDALKIDGHNPLTLLHGPLSEGIHGLSDEECLQLATDVRNVLAGLAERLTAALKEEAELSESVKRLLAANSKRPRKG